jgi:hypothetical protein
MYPKVDMIEEARDRRKELKIANNNETHHNCVRTRHAHTKKTHTENCQQHRIVEKGKELQWRGITLT